MAAKNFGRVNVSITASTGGLTAGLASAGKQLQGFRSSVSGSAGTVDQLNAAVGESAGFFSDVPGLFGSFASALLGVSRSAGIATIGIRVLTLAIRTLLVPLGIIAAIAAPFRAFANAASELDDASKSASRLGLSLTTFQNLSMMAEESGVEIGAFTNLLTKMTVNLGNLQSGSKAAQSAFAGIGMTFADLQGLSPEQQFDKISRAIMALPQGERLSAAYKIFGKSGAAAMGLIAAAANGTRAEVAQLQAALGVTFSDEQLRRGLPQGIEMMNDAMGRLGLLTQGFFNQLVGELAPAIATVANLFVQFFAENTSGWTLAKTLAYAFGGAIKFVAGTVTVLYGTFQVLSSFAGVFITGLIKAFEGVTWAIQNTIAVMARAAEALPGFDVGLASSLRAAEQTMAGLSNAAGDEAVVWATAAGQNFADGMQNILNPLAAFDAEFANVTATMQQAGATAGKAAGDGISKAVKASTQALQAIVVGTGGGEAFRNSILRGADPRLEGDAAKETADNTERTADAVEDLAGELAGVGGLGLATISV